MVQQSPDLTRVLALPRRKVSLEQGAELARELTPLLARRPGVALLPLQALSLKEVFDCRGGFLGLPVGEGKTLIGWLLPYVLGISRAWLVIPGGARKKTFDELSKIAQDWVAPNPPAMIRSYNELQVVKGVDLLERDAPRLLILDEGHKTRRPTAAATRRIARYVDAHHDVIVVVMTGTPGRHSVLDYAHQLIWTLREGAPVPLDMDQLDAWAGAIDAKPKNGLRVGTGALKAFGGFGLKGLQEGFRSRLVETPGVIIVDTTLTGVDLTIRQQRAPDDLELEDHFKRFRCFQKTPDGWPLSDNFSVMRHADELGSGFYYRWNPRPPKEWLEARCEFCNLVREKIEESQDTSNPLDTEHAVSLAYKSHPAVLAWRSVRKTFIPNSEPVWLTGSVVYEAIEWLRTHPVGLIWTQHRALGQAIAEVSGLNYFGAKGENAAGKLIDYHQGAAVVSFQANSETRNLQFNWHENLIVGWPPAATWVEQFLGRTHRRGQSKGVTVDVLITCRDTLEAFGKSEAEAEHAKNTFGQTQKILLANIQRCKVDQNCEPTFRFGHIVR